MPVTNKRVRVKNVEVEQKELDNLTIQLRAHSSQDQNSAVRRLIALANGHRLNRSKISLTPKCLDNLFMLLEYSSDSSVRYSAILAIYYATNYFRAAKEPFGTSGVDAMLKVDDAVEKLRFLMTNTGELPWIRGVALLISLSFTSTYNINAVAIKAEKSVLDSLVQVLTEGDSSDRVAALDTLCLLCIPNLARAKYIAEHESCVASLIAMLKEESPQTKLGAIRLLFYFMTDLPVSLHLDGGALKTLANLLNDSDNSVKEAANEFWDEYKLRPEARIGTLSINSMLLGGESYTLVPSPTSDSELYDKLPVDKFGDSPKTTTTADPMAGLNHRAPS